MRSHSWQNEFWGVPPEVLADLGRSGNFPWIRRMASIYEASSPEDQEAIRHLHRPGENGLTVIEGQRQEILKHTKDIPTTGDLEEHDVSP